MQFNTLEYACFLVSVFAIYWCVMSRLPLARRSGFLVLASLFFYGWYSPVLALFPIVMMMINYPVGGWLRSGKGGRSLLVIAVVLNLLPLAFYKYTTFLIPQLKGVLKLAVPLGISYLTFVQLSYLVDAARGKGTGGFADYALASVFWPKLVAGPIVRPVEFVRQWSVPYNRRFHLHRIYLGIVIFVFGLGKKMVLADSLGAIADWGYAARPGSLTVAASWITTLAYTLQLYYDFSGYSDMAWGSAILFNIKLPWNFKSPYKANSIQDFWRRWHVSLSLWLRDYLYFTFGGSRKGMLKTVRNVMLTFTIGGIWHGAGWTFIAWGAMHGLMLSVNNLWRKYSPVRIPRLVALVFTLLGVHVAWVFFRAPDITSAWAMLESMFGFGGALGYDWSTNAPLFTYGLLAISAFAVFMPNTYGLLHWTLRRSHAWMYVSCMGAACGMVLLMSLVCGMSESMPKTPFVYFQF